MNESGFHALIDNSGSFELRKAMERLRDGLFDPLGVKLFTIGEAKLYKVFEKGINDLKAQKSAHLCVCGDYGQGKSHALNYIKQQACAKNFVTSYINLDPRHVPFHNFKYVYKAMAEAIEFPDKQPFVSVWKVLADKWLGLPENDNKTIQDLIPKEIPHRFKSILTAIAQNNISIPLKKKKLKKHVRFKPREFPWILKNALMGKNIPVWKLRSALYYRQVSFYKESSLVLKEQEQYILLVQGLAKLFKKIGFNGWVVLFDEGESIAQTPITCRCKSYKLLNKIFSFKDKDQKFYPVFAFTNDFFLQLADEDYDRFKKSKNEFSEKTLYFDKNYSKAWNNLNIHRLFDISSKNWKILIKRLIKVHTIAYNWKPLSSIEEKINQEMSQYTAMENRLKLKFLVNFLDIEQQSQVTKNFITTTGRLGLSPVSTHNKL